MRNDVNFYHIIMPLRERERESAESLFEQKREAEERRKVSILRIN